MPAANNKAVWDLAFKILSILVIPLFLWGVKLEVGNAVRDTQIVRLKEDLDKASSVQDKISRNTAAVIKLEVQMTAAADSLKEIERLLRANPLPP